MHIELRNVPEALHQAAVDLVAELMALPGAQGHSAAVHGAGGEQIYGQTRGDGAPAEPAPPAAAEPSPAPAPGSAEG